MSLEGPRVLLGAVEVIYGNYQVSRSLPPPLWEKLVESRSCSVFVIHQRNPSEPFPLFGGGLGEPLEMPKVVFGQASAEPVFQNAGDYVGEGPQVVRYEQYIMTAGGAS